MKIAKKLIVTLLIISTIAVMIPITASATSAVAWGAADVGGSGVRIRSGPSLDHPIRTNVSRGEVVVIISRSNSDWYRVNFHGTIGYMSAPFLENSRTAANFRALGKITGSSVNMRARPEVTSDRVASHRAGTEMTVVGINNGWYKVEHGGNTGYVRSDLMELIPRQSTSATTTSNANSLGQQIANFGVEYVGHRYTWGGASPSTGFDCSGFVTYVLKNFNIKVTRNSAGQFRDNGVHVNRSELAPGDLVFFASGGGTVNHVGIYIGNDRYVHSSGAGVGFIISTLSSRTLHGAKRVV